MNDPVVLRLPRWSVVAALVTLIALVALVAVLRSAPGATAAPGQGLAARSGVYTVDRVKLSVGEQVTLYRNAAFKVVARCLDLGGGQVEAAYGLRALVDNALAFSTDASNETDTRLDRADGLWRWSGYEPSDTMPRYYGYDYYQEVIAESPRGDVLIARVSAGVHMRGADCIYNGLFID